MAIATDRHDGSVHPLTVDPDLLAVRQLAVAANRWLMVDEVHGTAVHRSDGSAPWSATVGVADVITTTTDRQPIAVWTADCAPLILFDSDGATVGCHAGWRGVAAGVIEVAVAETNSDVVAVLGPCIHSCCYEFGADDLVVVADALGVDVAEIQGQTQLGQAALDVPAAVRTVLDRYGIDLDVEGPCTGCDERWFSHRVRRDAGRQAVVAWTEQR